MTLRKATPREFVHTLERKFNIFTVLNINSNVYDWHKMNLLCRELDIEGKFNVDVILDDDYHSVEITKLYQYIIKNEDELILWRLL